MADTTRLKSIVEDWYRKKLSTNNSGMIVVQETVPLKWGGKFECDAVLKTENTIKEVHCLSISEYKTISGNGGSGKINKIKADALMLLGIDSPKKILAFTGKTMFDKITEEKQNGRFPKEIELIFVETKEVQDIAKAIAEVRKESIEEMI